MSKSQIHFTRRNATEKMEFIRKQMKIKEKDFDTFSVDVLDLEGKSAIELIHNYIEAIPEERRYLPNQTILISKKLYNQYCKEYFVFFPIPTQNKDRPLDSPIIYSNFTFIIH